MNTLTRSLADFCRAHPGDEKWLVAPTIRAGHQWIDSAAASGAPLLNLHAITLRGAAARLALKTAGARQPEILRSLDSLLLCGSLFQAGRERDDSYLLSLRPSLPLLRRLARLIEELRLAGLTPQSLTAGVRHRLKGTELAGLLDSYSAFLEKDQLTDYPAMLRLAADAARGSGGNLPFILLPDETRESFSHLENELLDSFPAARVITLEIDKPENGYGWEKEIVEDFRFPAAIKPGVEIIRAAGSANEIRQVLRRILSGNIPLDHVELMHTSREHYVPLIYEILSASVPPGALPPVTFADGVPSRLTRPGRALEAWLRWVGGGYQPEPLLELVSGGLLKLPDGTEHKPSYLASVLSSLPLGEGRQRLRDILARELRRAERGAAPGREDDDGDFAQSTDRRRLAALQLLSKLIAGLLEFSPEHPTGKALAEGAMLLLEHRVAYVNELDTYARRALLDRVQGLVRWLEVRDGAGFDTAAWLAEVAGSVQVMGNAPQPGKLHVSGIAAGGHTGRPLSVIVGLDDSRWPPSDSQNPLLPDNERTRLGSGLATAADNQRRAVREFELLLCRVRGRVLLSYASSDPLDDREQFPSPLLLPVYRRLAGDKSARQKQMVDSLGRPGSFAPATNRLVCREADWWLSTLLDLPPERGAVMIEGSFPHLARGAVALEYRGSELFTEFDGCLAAPGSRLDPFSPEGPVFSASGLKTLGECPRRYFYRYVLGLEEPRTAPPLSQWLDAAEAGQLLHEVLQRFLSRLAEAGALPLDSPEQRSLLKEIAGQTLEQFRESSPVPGEAAYRAREAWLEQALRAFLVQEAEYCRAHLPRWLEASIGIAGFGGQTEIGCDEPVALPVSGGTLRVRGRVDRIDRLADGSGYTITDYKSGGSSRYLLSKPFNGGRRVQHALYLAIVRRRLAELEPGADVSRFRYFFPAGSERGESREWTAGELARGAELIGRLCGISRDGAFAATDDIQDDCRYCPFQQLCGDLEAQAEAGERKRQNPANTVLKGVAAVREYD